MQFATVRCDEIAESVFVAGSGTSESGVRHPFILASTAYGPTARTATAEAP